MCFTQHPQSAGAACVLNIDFVPALFTTPTDGVQGVLAVRRGGSRAPGAVEQHKAGEITANNMPQWHAQACLFDRCCTNAAAPTIPRALVKGAPLL